MAQVTPFRRPRKRRKAPPRFGFSRALPYVSGWALIGAVLFAVYLAYGGSWQLRLFLSGKAEPTQPFANCSAARAAGYYGIPKSSPAYTERQDADGDGMACDPYPFGRWRR